MLHIQHKLQTSDIQNSFCELKFITAKIIIKKNCQLSAWRRENLKLWDVSVTIKQVLGDSCVEFLMLNSESVRVWTTTLWVEDESNSLQASQSDCASWRRKGWYRSTIPSIIARRCLQLESHEHILDCYLDFISFAPCSLFICIFLPHLTKSQVFLYVIVE